jgi:hypothetical protein
MIMTPVKLNPHDLGRPPPGLHSRTEDCSASDFTRSMSEPARSGVGRAKFSTDNNNSEFRSPGSITRDTHDGKQSRCSLERRAGARTGTWDAACNPEGPPWRP